MFSHKFIQLTFLPTLIITFLSSILLIYDNKFEPSLGLFIFFVSILGLNLTVLSKTNAEYKLSVASLSLILSYLFVCFGFILNTKNHLGSFFALFVLLALFNINVNIAKLYSQPIVRYFQSGIYYLLAKSIELLRYLGDTLMTFVNYQRGKSVSLESIKRISLVLSVFVLVGVPLLLVVVALLSSANSLFSEWLSSFQLPNFELGIWIIRAIFMVIIFPWLLAEFIFARVLQVNKDKISLTKISINKDFSEASGVAVVLIILMLNLFYILFVIAELKYDLGNLQQLIAERGLDSFSKLAVSRFWELIWVGIINISVLYFGRRFLRSLFKKDAALKIFTSVNVGLIFLNTVFLIFSSYQRLQLYISGYGFTHKRFEALTFLPLLLVIATLVLLTIFLRNQARLISLSFALLVLYFSVMAMLPTTYVVNQLNLDLGQKNQIQVVDPLYTLPTGELASARNGIFDNDGLLAAKHYLAAGGLSETDRTALEKAVSDYQNSIKESSDWREFNLVRFLLTE